MFFVVYTQGEPPILDDTPQSGDGVRSVPLALDERAGAAVRSLLALRSFEVTHALAAVYSAGVNAGQRAARSRSQPPS